MFVMPDLIRHPVGDALDPGSESGVTLRGENDRTELLEFFEDCRSNVVEVLEDVILFMSMVRNITGQGVGGTFAEVGREEGFETFGCGTGHVVFKRAVFWGAGVLFEGRDGDKLGVQRLVESTEQVFSSKEHCCK